MLSKRTQVQQRSRCTSTVQAMQAHDEPDATRRDWHSSGSEAKKQCALQAEASAAMAIGTGAAQPLLATVSQAQQARLARGRHVRLLQQLRQCAESSCSRDSRTGVAATAFNQNPFESFQILAKTPNSCQSTPILQKCCQSLPNPVDPSKSY